MSSVPTVTLRQVQGFAVDISFGPGLPTLRGDEPPPLGHGAGPTPGQLLCAAVANCLTDSLYFALTKFKQDPGPLTSTASAEVGRNAEGRLRVLRIAVEIRLGVAAAGLEHLDRALGQFEEFCTVGRSVAAAIPVEVSVVDADGQQLK